MQQLLRRSLLPARASKAVPALSTIQHARFQSHKPSPPNNNSHHHHAKTLLLNKNQHIIPDVLFYEYTGLKRLRFVRDGLLPISAYFAVKLYLGSKGMFEQLLSSAQFSALELGIFSTILFGHYSYLRKLVHSVSLDGKTQMVGIRTFGIFGQPGNDVRRYRVADMQLQTDERQNILSVVNSKEYFFLERNNRVEKLFPKQQQP